MNQKSRRVRERTRERNSRT